MMNMIWGWNSNVCVVFEEWHITNTGQWIGSVIGLWIICFLREFTAIFRKLHARSMIAEERSSAQQPFLENQSKSQTWSIVVDSLWYLANLTLSYFLMLVFMTYNGGIIITVLFGCFASHFLLSMLVKRKTGAAAPMVGADHCCDEI